MDFGYLWDILGKDEDEIYGVRARNWSFHNLVDRAGLARILRGTLKYRLEAGCVLELFVCIGISIGLKGGDGVVRS